MEKPLYNEMRLGLCLTNEANLNYGVFFCYLCPTVQKPFLENVV